MQLTDPVEVIEGIGTKARAALRKQFGITTVGHLVEHYPRRYRDMGEVMDVRDVTVGEPATLIGTVIDWSQRRTSGRGRGRALTISEAKVRGAGGGSFAVTFFNQPWQQRKLPPGVTAAFSGKVETFRGDLKLTTPEVQVLGGRDLDGIEHQRLLPVYPATDATPDWRLAQWIEAALDQLPPFPDHLPERLLDEQDLVTLDDAMRGIHLPPDRETAAAARRRLVFDELFTLQLGLQWRRAKLESELAGKANTPTAGGRADAFLASLPFAPTGAQSRSFDEIAGDLSSDRPMHRLLQGDVGSGKTLVAVWTMLCAVDNGRQAALMVPTEVLAEQHLRTLTEQLAPLGVNVLDGLRVELLTSSTTTTNKRRILGELLAGGVDLVVGTHALLEEGVRFADLGVVVIDEQHRFGVSQRVALKEKGSAGGVDLFDQRERLPDVLVMTATPIPRSLALTLYGDLDVTVLDELPPGRKPIVTQLITPAEPARREKLYGFVREQAAAGFQTYVVCPLVEDSDALAATSATAMHRHLADEVFPDLTVELVHGQMRSDDKDAAMQRFRRGEAQVLVATTVIEVGVDVSNATVMVIEDAERFGISQLHQLRGRVGRGADRSYCVLFAGWNTDELTEDASERLAAVAATTDGFELAEKDLEIRGEGQLFGAKQSGLPDLKLARLQRDHAIIVATRDLARAVVAEDPHLTAPANASLRAEVLRRYEGGLDDFAALETG
ncbi:MAG: ATP-dependent DNA helicase RecG [Actinobacteria bacterium]|nr:ATP-dependent DNA helicase RecG [Actinomycetota bacterium]